MNPLKKFNIRIIIKMAYLSLLRIWVQRCSTVEEVYLIAMTIQEYMIIMAKYLTSNYLAQISVKILLKEREKNLSRLYLL